MSTNFFRVLFLNFILVALLQTFAFANVVLRVGESRYVSGDQVSCVSGSHGGGGGGNDITSNSCICDGSVGKLLSENDYATYESILYVYDSQSSCAEHVNTFKYCKAPYAEMHGRFNVCGCDDNIAYVHTIRPNGQSSATKLYEYNSADGCIDKIFTWPQCK